MLLRIIIETIKHYRSYGKDPRDHVGVVWRNAELISYGLLDELTKQNRSEINKMHKWLSDAIIEPSLDDCEYAKKYESIILEDDSFGEEPHEYNKKRGYVTEPTHGDHIATLAYRLTLSPEILYIRMVFEFDGGIYNLIEEIQDGFEEVLFC